MLTTLHVFSYHMWLVAAVLESADEGIPIIM